MTGKIVFEYKGEIEHACKNPKYFDINDTMNVTELCLDIHKYLIHFCCGKANYWDFHFFETVTNSEGYFRDYDELDGYVTALQNILRLREEQFSFRKRVYALFDNLTGSQLEKVYMYMLSIGAKGYT